MELQKYHPLMKSDWDNLVKNSRNGTFLLLRDYMDYHASRFTDASMVAVDDNGTIVAVLPAERRDDTVNSHGGLTYGGWILGFTTATSATGMDNIIKMMLAHFRAEGVKHLVYKPVPHIYHRLPCEEDIYFLWRNGATLAEVTLSSVIDLNDRLPMSRSIHAHINRARHSLLAAVESKDLKHYWEILSDRLSSKYNALPVHSLDEISLLADRFPQNIKLWTVSKPDGEMIAGILLFLCGNVAKAQYIASTASGREINALDFLVNHLAGRLSQQGFHYFDLGTSCEDHGRFLNTGLITQKTRYGARGIAYPVYKIDI